jgi:very-short-patch-repair endonuclease
MTQYFNRSSEKDNRRQLRHSMPKAEVLLWQRLRGRQLLGCKFRRQYSVGPYVLDFYCSELRLGIELDGDSHFQPGALEYDQKRDQFVATFGIRILHFLNTDVYENIDGILESIADETSKRLGARS